MRDAGFNVIEYNSNNFNLTGEISIPKEVETVFHLAALNRVFMSQRFPKKTFWVNAYGTLNLLEAIKESNVKKIIFTSTILVYKDLKKTHETDDVGSLKYPYGIEKQMCEEYIRYYSNVYGLKYVIHRISSIYGPGMVKGPLYDIINSMDQPEIRLWVNRKSSYNFIHVEDVVNALVESLNWENDTFNLCSDEHMSLEEICQFLFGKGKIIRDTPETVEIRGYPNKIKTQGWKPRHFFRDWMEKVKI